jgi:protein-disulfide isomerase
VVVFHDYQCPPCRAFHRARRQLLEQHSGDKLVRIELREFPLDASCNPQVTNSIHPAACLAAVAAKMAGHDESLRARLDEWLYDHQGSLSERTIEAQLETLGFRHITPSMRQAAHDAVLSDLAMARDLEVHSTPTVFVNGVRLNDWSTLAWAIERERNTITSASLLQAPDPRAGARRPGAKSGD